MKNIGSIVSICLIWSVTLNTSTHALPSQPGDLKNIKSVQIVVEKTEPDLQSVGLNVTNITAEIRPHLEDYGLKTNGSLPILDIAISTLTIDNGYCFTLSVTLVEPAKVRGRVIGSTTWSSGSFGITDKSEVYINILNAVLKDVDAFVSDWRRDNS